MAARGVAGGIRLTRASAAGIAVFVLWHSCGDEEIPPASGGETAAPAVSGDRDRFGPLPEKVGAWPVSRGAAAGYVSDRACEECHRDVWDEFQTSGMSKSFLRPDPAANAVEDLRKPFHHEATDFYYEMSVRDGKYYLQRYCKDPRGERFAVYEAEVAWVMGVGKPIRAYLSQNVYGELYQLPVCWYSDGGWGMAPGYDTKGHKRFERMVDRTCMSCHSAYPETPVGSDLPHKPNVFPLDMQPGIGCQRCHGPGARHVEWALRVADEAAPQGPTRILNPARFTDQQQSDLCLMCHLETEALQGNMLIRAFDRPMHSLLPGMDLTEFVCHLDHGSKAERTARVQAGGQAYRLRWSKCHEASGGKMHCLTCHDPHRKIPKAEQADFYRAKCLQCHGLLDCRMEGMGTTCDPVQSDCVSCHMFEARPEDIVRVTIRDHYIRRFPPSGNPTAPRAEVPAPSKPLQVVPFFPERSGRDPRWDVYAGFAANYTATEESLRAWRDAFVRTKPHPVAGYVNVGRGLMEAGDFTGAIDLLAEGADRFDDSAEIHWILGEAHLGGGHVSAALVLLNRAHELDASDPGIHSALADALARVGQHDKAKSHFEQSLKLRPNSSLTWQHYAYTLVRLRDLDGAVQAFRAAIALNPDDVYSYRTIGSVHKIRGNLRGLYRVLEQGASRLPELRADLVIARLSPVDPSARDAAAALELARKMVGERPEDGRGRLHLALAQLFSGASGEALREIERAADLGADPACVSALRAVHSFGRGDRAKANEHVARFQRELETPNDEPLRQTLVELLGDPASVPRTTRNKK